MEDSQKKAILEAILFVAGEPVDINSLKKVTDFHETEIKKLLNELTVEYRERNAGLIIAEIADGYQLVTNPDYGTWIRKFKNVNQTNRLSQSALETLAIIAYKQPITKLEIDQIRGVNSDSAIKGLIDKRLIKIVGKKESPGRPFLYSTTKEFLRYFGLKSLSDLPPINTLLNDEAA